MKRTVIIGAGIIGLATAYYLTRAGQEVTIFEKNEPGDGCSSVNMGWICPTLSQPLPAPGVIGGAIRGIFDRANPLYMGPASVLPLVPWLMKFARSATQRHYEAGLAANLEVSRLTVELFADFASEIGESLESYDNGLLVVGLNDGELQSKRSEFTTIASRLGLRTPVVLSNEETLELEPALSPKIVGGLLLPDDRHVRPESFTEALTTWLLDHGVEFRTNLAITEMRRSGAKVDSVVADGETIPVRSVLVAAGVWSRQLLRDLDFNLPVVAGKGYSVTGDFPGISLSRPVYLGSAGLSPFDGGLRYGGTMEFSGINTRIDSQRVDSISQLVSRYLARPVDARGATVRAGLRPMAPDGLPVMGQVPGTTNAYVATGHVMSGLSMALATGHIMSELITHQRKVVDLELLDPRRFK